MTFPKARLAVSACLFVGWLGFLLFLVLESDKIILSKPQFLIAQLVAVVEVRDQFGKPDPQVVIEEVLWGANRWDEALEKMELQIPDLAECTKKHGYQGPGKYLVPLIRSARTWRIAPLPRTAQTVDMRIYPWTPETKAQIEAILAAQKPR